MDLCEEAVPLYSVSEWSYCMVCDWLQLPVFLHLFYFYYVYFYICIFLFVSDSYNQGQKC